MTRETGGRGGPKARFRSLAVPVSAVDKNAVESSGPGGGGELPSQVDPRSAADLWNAEPWYSSAVDVIARCVSTAEVFSAFQSADPGLRGDPALLDRMTAFLESQDREMLTVQERLSRLDTDLSLQNFCAMEITRDSGGLPAAWYHAPAVSLRVRRDGTVRQLAGPGRPGEVFLPYRKGGYLDGSPEMLVIRRYDPLAENVGGSQATPLLSTMNRMGRQDAYNNRLLGAGGLPPKLLLLKETLDDTSYVRLQEFLKGLAKGSSSEVIGILDGVGEGSKLEELLQSAVDMAFKDGEDAGRQRILAKLGVPPTKVCLSAANYATSYQEDATFKFEVTQPRLRVYLRRLTGVAQDITQNPGYYYGFRQQTLEDFNQLVQALDLLLQKGGLTLNQALQRAGFPPMGPDGDVHIAWTNQGPVLVSDLAQGKGPPTPGRLVDVLFQLRSELLKSMEGHEHPA